MDRETQRRISIGIGVTSTPNRSEYIDTWLKEFEKVKPNNYHLHIHEDVHYHGVAYSKNQNLKTLQDNDYIFLFDDDCYPVKEGWADYFINSKQNHLLYLTKIHNKIIIKDDIEIYQDCGGVFMFLTKKDIEKAGAFNEEFGLWGFEHADYSRRISPSCPYQMLVGTEDYLYAEDYSNPNHKSSITNEEKNFHFKKNFPKFATKVYQTYIPL